MSDKQEKVYSDMMTIAFELNGNSIQVETSSSDTALMLIRNLGLTGTKEGCGIGECGACTIIVDGLAVNSCLMLAPQLDGRKVETIESIAELDEIKKLQESFISHGAVQCGFCMPGMLTSLRALLLHNPKPSRDEIKQAIGGNLCRCTGYVQIIEAVDACV